MCLSGNYKYNFVVDHVNVNPYLLYNILLFSCIHVVIIINRIGKFSHKSSCCRLLLIPAIALFHLYSVFRKLINKLR